MCPLWRVGSLAAILFVQLREIEVLYGELLAADSTDEILEELVGHLPPVVYHWPFDMAITPVISPAHGGLAHLRLSIVPSPHFGNHQNDERLGYEKPWRRGNWLK